MATDDPLHGRETDAGSFKLLVRVEPPEWSEELAHVGHVEPGTIVAHVVRGDAVLFLATELDPRRSPRAGKLPGVPKQVLQECLQELWIALRDKSVRNHDFDLAARLVRSKLLRHTLSQLRQVHGF